MCWRQLFPAKESWLWTFLPNSVFTEIMVITCSQPQWKYYTNKKTLESLLDCKEIQPVHSEGDQSWVFIGRSDAKAETPVLWPPHAKSWLIAKDSDAGRDWGQGEKGMTEDEMAGWHHQLNGHEFEWSPGLLMDREAWRAAIPGVAKSQTWLSDCWTELNQQQLQVRNFLFFFSLISDC